MFEYLMPLLIMPTYENTLLDQTYKAAVKRQIDEEGRLIGDIEAVPFDLRRQLDYANLVAQPGALFTRGAFEAVGGLDETYRHIGEDVDFCVRAIRVGYALGYCADAVVTHDAEHRLRPLLRRSWSHGYSGNQQPRQLFPRRRFRPGSQQYSDVEPGNGPNCRARRNL